MRYLLFTLLGFFGPALIMLLLRLMWFQLKQRFIQKNSDSEIIDVTPIKGKPSKLFIGTWLVVSVLCTAMLIWQIGDKPASNENYIPAHINAEGEFIPATTIPDHPIGQR